MIIRILALLSMMVFLDISAWSIFKPWTYFQETRVKGSGKRAGKTIPIAGVTDISVYGIGTCIIVQDSAASEELIIEADDNILPYIEVLQDGNGIIITLKHDTSITTQSDIIYRITVKNLESIHVSDAVKLELENITTDALDITAAGASIISGSLDVQKLQVSISGASSVEVSGVAQKQYVDISGASRFDGSELRGFKAEADCSGSSRAIINVTNSLKGLCEGVSTIKYKNNPQVKVKTAGISSVKKI